MYNNKYMTVCRICGQETPYTRSTLCDECWELDTVIRRNPELAAKILAIIKLEGEKNE